ncbi:MAG TPA: hypothetical protein VIX91_25440, partial [Candidatus Acidoferrum sp.]
MPHAHLFSSEEPPGSQPSVTTLQIKGLSDVSNLFEVERFVLPSPSPFLVQNLGNLAITVVVQELIDLGSEPSSAGQKLWKRRAKKPLEIKNRFPLSHSSNNNNLPLDDRDHFLQTPPASVAS